MSEHQQHQLMASDEELVSPMSNLSLSANTTSMLVGSVNNPEVDQSDEGGEAEDDDQIDIDGSYERS